MRIEVVKPSDDLPTLKRQIILIQDNINKALAALPFDYAQRLAFDFYPEQFPMLISHQMKKPAWGLKCLYLRNKSDDAAYPTDGMYIDWIPESGGIKIRGINGLLAANLYHIELMVFG